MTLRVRFVIFCASAALTTGCVYFRTAPPAPCYQLTKGPWSIPIIPASDSTLHTPPPLVHLTMQIDSTNPYRRLAIGYSVSDSIRAFRTEGSWRWSSRDSLSLAWGDMFSGVGLKVAVVNDSLRGEAHIYSDDLSSRYLETSAPVWGAPVPCPASPDGR